jgi:hypothetical protein
MVSNFHVALVSVENNGFLRVVLFHHFHSQTTNGRLEVCLFGVNHASEIDYVVHYQAIPLHCILYLLNWIGRVCLLLTRPHFESNAMPDECKCDGCT